MCLNDNNTVRNIQSADDSCVQSIDTLDAQVPRFCTVVRRNRKYRCLGTFRMSKKQSSVSAFFRLMIVSSCGLVPTGTALAQARTPVTEPPPQITPQITESKPSTIAQQRTLDRMLKAPLDHENTFAYVKACVEARDFEAAIGALERLLIYNPGLVRVNYELGTLYYRMASYAMAVHYFEEAEKSPGIDEPLRRRIASYLPDARKQLMRSRISGSTSGA